jgi:hypothetical protein
MGKKPVMNIEYKIWVNGSLRNFKPTSIVRTFRAVESFINYNPGLRRCLVKQQGGYYKLGLDGILTFAFHALGGVTFEQLYNILKD